ncbi:unnamed protein product [Symbiodinium sp. CCMP2456]|nr:unnamed protein product [Symbiodinium sp. CCMP2456]
MSRDSLLHTIRSAVDSLRTALQELEEAQNPWEIVELDDHAAPQPSRGPLAGPRASSSGAPAARSSPPAGGLSPSCVLTGSQAPRIGDPLPGDALFLVSSLHIIDRRPRAVRAWEAGLQAGAVLRQEQEVRVFTTFGRFKLHTGPLEQSRTVCHGFPTEGVLGAVPSGFLDASLVSAGQTGALEAVVGPSVEVALTLAEEEEDGSLRPVEESCNALLVDFSLEVAAYVSRYDPVTSPVEAVSFVPERPDQQVSFPEALATARAWLAAEEGERLAFYSAAEGGDALPQGQTGQGEVRRKAAPKAKRHTNAQLAEQIGNLVDLIPALTQQVQDLSLRQSALEKKAAVPAMPQPSPEEPQADELMVDEETGEPLPPESQGALAKAMLQQSRALGTLVTHLVTQADASDPSLSSLGVAALGSRGASKRERLQEQLATRSGSFLLQVSQQALRRLSPSEPVPSTRAELLARKPVFTLYAERFGGFGSQRGLGIMFWLLANILDALVAGDTVGAEEMASLALIATEQASQDSGSWDIAYLLTLLEDPPHQLFAHRSEATAAAKAKAQPSDPDQASPFEGGSGIFYDRIDHLVLHMPSFPCRRVAHVAVMACNFLFSGASFVPLGLLSHRPNKAQAAALSYVHRLCRACGAVEPFLVSSAGRRNLSLLSQLGELCEHMTLVGPSADPYGPSFHGAAPRLSLDTVGPLPGASGDDLEPTCDGSPSSLRPPSGQTHGNPLMPYAPLCAERLKISGLGQWDPVPFLDTDPDLQVACLEPDLLLRGAEPPPGEVPDLRRERPGEVLRLALKWAEKGLLFLKDDYSDQASHEDAVRVFNCYKASDCDRQIGDRRARNFRERALRGPSTSLPCGPVFLGLCIPPSTSTLRIAVADRKDFYHQLRVGPRKAVHNALFPPLLEKDLVGTEAHRLLCEQRALREPRALLVPPPDRAQVVACFKAIFQGDHLGVEIATCAHRNMLRASGLLVPREELLSTRPFPPSEVLQGLVIDDFYAVSLESLDTPPERSRAVARLDLALEAYEKHRLLGSVEKNVRGSDCSRVAGAELDSSPGTRQLGLVTAGAPRAKRLSLASISLSLASLPSTTEALHSCLIGGWVSAFIYRRPLMAVFQKAFAVCPSHVSQGTSPAPVPLTRGVSDELVLAAALAPLAVADLAAPWDDHLYATDSSEEGAAIVCTPVSEATSAQVWRASDRKGASTKLLSRIQAAVRKADPLHEEACLEPPPGSDALCVGSDDFGLPLSRPGRPLGLRFHFVQVGGPGTLICDALSQRGWVPGPVLHLDFSPHYDLGGHEFFLWLVHLLDTGGADAFYLRPPSHFFSAVAWPPPRPLKGTKPCAHERRALLELCLARRALFLFHRAIRVGALCMLEQPFGSQLPCLSPWKGALRHRDVVEVSLSACMFGSPQKRRFRLLSHRLPALALGCKCSGKHLHQAGPAPRGGATSIPGLAEAIAQVFSRGLRRLLEQRAGADIDVYGLESPLINDLALSSDWKVQAAWRWDRESHINVFETEAYFRLCLHKARLCRPCRFSSLIDSNVARCALSKGRSPSVALTRVLKKVSAVSLTAGLYGALPFCPTRIMPADNPSRGSAPSPPVPGQPLTEALDLEALAALPRLRRWASNWVRLVLRSSPWFSPSSQDRFAGMPSLTYVPPAFDFDSSLGFPGEGPRPCAGGFCFWGLFRGLVVACLLSCCHGTLEPRNAGDTARLQARKQKPLSVGRPVERITQKNRDRLWFSFSEWLKGQGVPLGLFDDAAVPDVDTINAVMVRYGRDLYSAGRPYSHFSETINALAAKMPKLRRLLQQSWDVAFQWQRLEPHVHHQAMPWQVLVAMLASALCWGWLDVAGILALAWGGLARIGEIFAAYRRDLVLPGDTGEGYGSILLSVKEPKTRNTAARHQAIRVDQPQLVQVVIFAFERMIPAQKLWPLSPSTFRSRFAKLIAALSLDNLEGTRIKPLDLGSLRAGGATWLLQTTEDGELVRRRGRWINTKVMDIYIQEVSAVLFLPRLPGKTRDKVLQAASSFPAMLQQAQALLGLGIPEHIWFSLTAAGTALSPAVVVKPGFQEIKVLSSEFHSLTLAMEPTATVLGRSEAFDNDTGPQDSVPLERHNLPEWIAEIISKMEPTRPLRVYGDFYHLSQSTTRLHAFWSHSWHGSVSGKVVTLFFLYKAGAAAAVGTGAAVLACFAFWLGALPDDKTSSWWCLSVGCLGYLLTMLFWPQQLVFVDRVCISQTDPELQAEGIFSLGAMVKRADTMLVLWDPSWARRLWCVYELAAFIRSRSPGEKPRIIIRPTMLGFVMCAIWLACALGGFAFHFTNHTIGVDDSSGRTDVILQFSAIAFCGLIFWYIAHLVREYCREVTIMCQHIGQFRVATAESFCCFVKHRRPGGDEPMMCDREVMQKCIKTACSKRFM